MPISLKPDPTPGHFYRSRTGDTWLGVTGRAYGVRSGGKRLRLSQMANAHPFNWRLHRRPKNTFERRHYPHGLIQLRRVFPCDEADFEASPWEHLVRGRCRSVIYIPPEDDVWYAPPPEVVQSAPLFCWAAALCSLSQSREVPHVFKTEASLVTRFRTLRTVESGRGRRIVSRRTGGLRYLPKSDRVMPDGGFSLARGEMSMISIAQFLDLDLSSYFGDADPGEVQADRDQRLTMSDLVFHLEDAGGPIAVFRQLIPEEKSPGHTTVVFGGSKTDGIFIEMDPFTTAKSGPVFGTQDTITVRDASSLGTSFGKPTREIYILH